MSTSPAAVTLSGSGRFGGRFGDRLLVALTVLAALAAIGVIGLIIEQIIDGSSLAVSKFGLGFLWHATWNPSLSPGVANANVYGAATLVFGTVVTSAIALVFAVPLGVAIGVYLALLAPGRAGAVIGPLVELLAAIPSVILGLWGILILAPFLRSTVEPALHDVLGWIPIFGPPSTTGLGVFTAGIVLAIMALPIIASISRDLFLNIPSELKDGALGDDPRCRPGLLQGRHCRRHHPRTEPGARRGDRRDPSDRHGLDHQQEPVRQRRLPGQPDRRAVLFDGEQAADSVAVLLRARPARDGTRGQPLGTDDRPALRTAAGSGALNVGR
jgi:hypothetical protein